MLTDHWTHLNIVNTPLGKLSRMVFFRKLMEIIVLSPLLCIPVFGDVLMSQCVASNFKTEKPSVGKLLWDSVVSFPSILYMKLCFWFPGFLLAFIPVYGLFASLRYRTYRAMVSSVVIFEGKTGKVGRQRCRELYKNDTNGFGAKVLILVPLMFLAPLIFTFIVFVNPFEHSIALWVHIFLVLWLITPATALLNTCYYLKSTGGSHSIFVQAPTDKERFIFNTAQQASGSQ